MKHLIILIVCMLFVSPGCRKNNHGCEEVTITRSGTPCSVWGIIVKGDTYPANAIPASFQQEGITVCVNYELYEDVRACACCGGTWAKINSIHY